MLNYIWFGMMLIAVVVGTITGNIDAVTEAAIKMAKTAIISGITGQDGSYLAEQLLNKGYDYKL